MPGILVSGDISDAMKAEVIVEEVMGLVRPKYTLRELCRVIDLGNSIILKGTIGTQLTGQEKVPALTAAEISSQAYAPLNVTCWKNVVHVAVSFEAQAISAKDVLQMQITDAARDIARMENKHVGTELETNTGLAGTDWGVGTNDPLLDIMAAIAAIEQGTGYTATHIAMCNTQYAELVGNALIKAAFERGTLAKTGRLPAIAGLLLRVDSQLTHDNAIVVDKDAPNTVLADGPQVVEEYKGRGAFFNGYAIADFIYPKLVLTASGRKLTGIS